ncbi:MAG: diacylglycerol/lipid kinase family protein [Candidatus Limivicinus sp.]|jgi:diacylglycerol kinase (ATP)
MEKTGLISSPKPAMLIINPVSGKKLVLKHVTDIIRTLMDAGYIVTTMVTSRRGEATEFIQRYGRNFQLICCTGGDGSLNEAVSGLAKENLDIPLGYIPCGSSNDFAVTHSLSTDIPTAARNIASGRTKRYDIGRFGDDYFSYIAAFGAFSWLSYTTDQNFKNLLGHKAYIIDAIKELYKIKAQHIRFRTENLVCEGDYIFGAVCNTTSIAATIELPPNIVDTGDGIFEVLLVKMPETIMELDTIIHGLLNQNYTTPLIQFFQARSIDIENAPGLVWALDGEPSNVYENIHIEPMRNFMNIQG